MTPSKIGFLILVPVFGAMVPICLPGWTVNLELRLDNRGTQNKVSSLTLREVSNVSLGHTDFKYQTFVEALSRIISKIYIFVT